MSDRDRDIYIYKSILENYFCLMLLYCQFLHSNRPDLIKNGFKKSVTIVFSVLFEHFSVVNSKVQKVMHKPV